MKSFINGGWKQQLSPLYLGLQPNSISCVTRHFYLQNLTSNGHAFGLFSTWKQIDV